MAKINETQLRLVYSLLRTPIRVAARFRIPVASLVDLVRVSYFETLLRQSLTRAEVARRMGQTERHMRTLAKKHAELFASEESGLRKVEGLEALNAHQDVVHQAVVHGLIFDDPKKAMLKTLTFKVTPAKLAELVARMEGSLRGELVGLQEDEDVHSGEARFMLGVSLAPLEE